MRSAVPFALAIIAAAAACHHAKSDFDNNEMQAAPVVRQPPLCAGEPYLEIHNPGNQPIDVYARIYTGSDRVFIGTATPSTNRLSLTGTPAENKSANFWAEVDGKGISTNLPTSPVTITRRCDKKS